MNRLRELREKAGLRQIDVANETGIDQKTLSNYETGKTNPDSYALIKLADFYNVSIDYIVGRIDIDFTSSQRQEINRCIESITNELKKIKKIL